MDDRDDRSKLATMRQVIQTLPLALEPDDGELERVYDIVVEHLKKGPAVASRDPWAHMAEHLKDSLPGIMEDVRLEPMQTRMVNSQTKQAPAGAQGVSPVLVVAAGLAGAAAAYALVCVAAAAYCMGGDAPAPGESVDVRC